jgi:tetratricopeptide (TPR) repeat protein
VTKRTTPRGRDPLERTIELALSPGYFVGDRACTSFVNDLEEAEAAIEPLIESAPDRAVALYEAFLAGCYAKAGEVDDSSGSFGMFVEELFCRWIRGRQAAGAPPKETAGQLIAWMDDDPHGFCYGLEAKVSSTLDKAGLAALVQRVRERFDDAVSTNEEDDDRHTDSDFERRRWGGVLRALYIGQRDVRSYVALAEETGLTAKDYQAVADLLIAKRKREDALSWVERGIEIVTKDPRGSLSGYLLGNLRRELLQKLGRGQEALDSAWAEYTAHPSIHSYRELLKFAPRHDRPTWHARAMDAAAGANLHSLLVLFVETKETERLTALVDRVTDDELETVSHYALEPAAQRLESSRPGAAARVWKATVMRVVNAGQSKYYEAALANLERAKRCYERAGLAAQWEEVVDAIRRQHHRKYGFMPGFEKIVSGSPPSEEPPFLELAKARWAKASSSRGR